MKAVTVIRFRLADKPRLAWKTEDVAKDLSASCYLIKLIFRELVLSQLYDSEFSSKLYLEVCFRFLFKTTKKREHVNESVFSIHTAVYVNSRRINFTEYKQLYESQKLD